MWLMASLRPGRRIDIVLRLREDATIKVKCTLYAAYSKIIIEALLNLSRFRFLRQIEFAL